jgi:hypothetical protein
MVPRDGGNTFSAHSVLNYTNQDLSSGKVSDALIARGSAASSNSLKKVYDYGLGVGGPIARDRLWFFSITRFWGSDAFGANNFFNKSPDPFVYVADRDRPAFTEIWRRDAGGRFTWQASGKHKINSSLNWQRACSCWLGIAGGQRASPEAVTSFDYGVGKGMWRSQTNWVYPASNRWLFEAAAAFAVQDVRFTNEVVPGPNTVAITEQTTGYAWGALPGSIQGGSYDAPHIADNFTQRASTSYVTGSHAFKTGLQTLQGVYDITGNALPTGVNYTFRNGRPLSVTQFASPFANNVRVRSVGLFGQDQWTVKRLTLNMGLRYDHFWAYAKAITLPPGPFVGERSFPEMRDIPNYHDISPRLGAAYDIFGNGRTAIKASWGRYLAGQGGGDARDFSPAIAVFTSTDRLWNDANGNFVPDCLLTNFLANGECGTVNNMAFGLTRPTTTWANSARTGWGVREFSYQYSVAVQHELWPGLGVTVAYSRNAWKNQQAVVNRALGVADFSSYCITAPTDTRLGNFGGNQVCGLYDENPAKFGQRTAERVQWQDVSSGNREPTEVFNGIDVAINARFGKGGVLLGGVTVGRTTFDYCWQNDLPNVTQIGTPGITATTPYATIPRTDGYCRIRSALWDGVGSQIKVQAIYPLPYDVVVSGSFKQLPGVPISANYSASNAEIAPSLGRDLSACRGAVGAACTARQTVALLPSAFYQGNTSAALYDERVNEVDVRVSRLFRLGKLRMQGIAELYNVFNIRPAQGIVDTYGPAWQLPFAILGGRLFKFGAEVDF